MAKRIVIAAAITVAFVIAIFAGSGEDTGIDVRSPKLEMAPTTVPEMINYQGVLTDDAGSPLDTTVSVTFTIYDAASGGTALWTETRGSVTVVGGVFTVLLGSGTPVPPDVFEGPDRWLGVKVGADPEMAPRHRIVSSAYTYRSGYAEDTDMLDGQHASDFAEAAHDHDDQYYTETELHTNDGAVNESGDPVSWYKIKNIPAGFADGTDDVGAGGISQIQAGPGIEVTNPTGPITTVSADIGTTASQVAAGDHEHDADYVNEGQTASVTSDMIVDGTVEQTDLSFGVPDGHSLDAADGSPTDALYVDNDGNVGIGTTSPVGTLDLSGDAGAGLFFGHVQNSLESAGNGDIFLQAKSKIYMNIDTNNNNTDRFFAVAKDNTGPNGVQLFRVQENGNVGIGTTSPSGLLHLDNDEYGRTGLYIDQDGAGTALHIDNSFIGDAVVIDQAYDDPAILIRKTATGSGNVIDIDNDGSGAGIKIKSDGTTSGYGNSLLIDHNANSDALQINAATSNTSYHGIRLTMESGSSSGLYVHMANASGIRYAIQIKNDSNAHSIYDDSGAYLTSGGTWTDACARSKKENFEELDTKDILDKVVDLDVSRYNMKKVESEKHISPFAEDFPELFGIGDGKGLAATDVAGVALLAIKQLKEENDALDKRIKALSQRLDVLESR